MKRACCWTLQIINRVNVLNVNDCQIYHIRTLPRIFHLTVRDAIVGSPCTLINSPGREPPWFSREQDEGFSGVRHNRAICHNESAWAVSQGSRGRGVNGVEKRRKAASTMKRESHQTPSQRQTGKYNFLVEKSSPHQSIQGSTRQYRR